jgi:hypothetical protein
VRTPLVGSSGKESNAVPLGAVRTYAQLAPGEEFTIDRWVQAIRAGRTFVTNGPLLTFTISPVSRSSETSAWADALISDERLNELGAGCTLRAERGQTLRLRATVISTTPFEQLELLANGEVLAGTSSATLEHEYHANTTAWLAARCRGAHTTPIWIDVRNAPHLPTTERVEPLLAILAHTRDWVRHTARCDDKHRAHLETILRDAETVLLARLKS